MLKINGYKRGLSNVKRGFPLGTLFLRCQDRTKKIRSGAGQSFGQKNLQCASCPPQVCKGDTKKDFPAFSESDLDPRTRKKLVATASRCEGVGEPSVTFCGKGGARKRADDLFSAKGKKRVDIFFVNPSWCRWWGSNPHVLADNGF